MYVSDGDYIQDIEVNDLRNRYMLMKAQTQQAVGATAVKSQTTVLTFCRFKKKPELISPRVENTTLTRAWPPRR